MSRRTQELFALLAGAVVTGACVAWWGWTAVGLVVGVAAITVAALVSPRWVLPAAVFLVTAIPHGSVADSVLALHVGPINVLPAEVGVAMAIVAAGAHAARSGRIQGPKTGLILLGVWAAAVVGGCVVGLLRGFSLTSVLQDLRPLLGYVGFWTAWQLQPERDSNRLAWALVAGCAAISVFNALVVTTGWQYATFMTDSGRVWFRNGILFPVALPLALGLAEDVSTAFSRFGAYAAAILIVIGTLVSGTRSYWVAVFLAVVLFLWHRLRRQRTMEQVAWASIAVGITAVVLAVAIVGTSSMVVEGAAGTLVGERLSSLQSLSTDSSLATRWRTYVTTNQQMGDSWIVGRGLGSRISLTGSGWSIYSTQGQYVDNVPQTVVLKTGLLGLAALVALWGWASAGALSRRGLRNPMKVALRCAIPGLALLVFLSSYLMIYVQLFVLAVTFGMLRMSEHGDEGCDLT